MQDNTGLQEVQKLLQCYDSINTVRSPTRTTSSTKPLIDVTINKGDQELLHFSDHKTHHDFSFRHFRKK